MRQTPDDPQANYHSDTVALIAASTCRPSTKRRCVRLLPRFVSRSQYCAVYSLLCQPLREREFITHFDSLFAISFWQIMGAEFADMLYDLFI